MKSLFIRQNAFPGRRVASREEAVEWAKPVPAVAGTKCEIRRVPSIDEFPQNKEWIIKEPAWRERTASSDALGQQRPAEDRVGAAGR